MASSEQMSEQAPLNPESQPVEGTAVTIKKEGKGWFQKKGKTNTTAAGKKEEGQTETATGEANKENNEGAGAAKKNWWTIRRCPKAVGTCEGGPTYGVNLVQRDDHQLQTGIDFGFEDIYGEPDSVHSFNGIWRTNFAVFNAVRSFFYKVFSCIVAIPLAVIFGILFALVSALSVYLCVPLGRLLGIILGWVAKVWSVVVSAICDPVFRSIGYLFSSVKVSRYGYNSDPTAVLSA